MGLLARDDLNIFLRWVLWRGTKAEEDEARRQVEAAKCIEADPWTSLISY